MTHMTQGACCLSSNYHYNHPIILGLYALTLSGLPFQMQMEGKNSGLAFVDSNGAKKVLLIEDYERQFGDKVSVHCLIEIVNYLSEYDYSFGWYSGGVEVYDEI